jgi:hypothetical protein
LENLPCSKNALTLVLDGGLKTVISFDRPPQPAALLAAQHAALLWRQFMMMRKTFVLRAAAAICTLLATACGSSGGPNTNLKSVFFRTVTAAPVATLNLKRADGTPMGNPSRVRIDTRATFDNWVKVGRTATANANASGVATIVLPAGSYPIVVDPNLGRTAALVGTLNDTLAISANMTGTWQTSKQNWTVTSPTGKPFSAVAVEIFQVDAGGAALYGADTLYPLNPLVLTATPAVPGGSQQSITFTTELFKGSYRAFITATPVATTDTIAPFETAVFSAAGGGATETQAIQLASGGNVVSLKFMEGAAVMLDSQIGNVSVFDAGSLILLNQGTSTNGVATLSTGVVANVIAIVSGPGGEIMAAASYTASPTHSATLTRYTVSGHVKAPAALVQPYGSVTATVKPNLGAFWDAQISGSPVTANITDAQGTYVLPLISGSWSLQAVTLTNLANSAAVSLSVNNANLTAQDISVNAGGVISGNIQDQTKINIPGVQVAVYTQDSSHTQVGTATTDAGGNYSIALVPFGTYEVFANGALTQGVAVSSSAATKTLNLTQFAISGRLTDSVLAPVVGSVTWGLGGNAVTAGALGTFTINVMQGLNWFLFQPPTGSSLGFAYELNALVNADTIKSLP